MLALACALDALADRTPGWLDIKLQVLDAGCGFDPLDQSPDATKHPL
ncbi:MAG: hypothetical protein ACE37F_02955 [Nannocystaceae bacterium]|nr:hypothetical protein [bacterium]